MGASNLGPLRNLDGLGGCFNPSNDFVSLPLSNSMEILKSSICLWCNMLRIRWNKQFYKFFKIDLKISHWYANWDEFTLRNASICKQLRSLPKGYGLRPFTPLKTYKNMKKAYKSKFHNIQPCRIYLASMGGRLM